MTSETEPNAQEMASEIEKDEYYDKSRFLSPKCGWKYNEYLGRVVVKDKTICLEKFEDGMLDFYGRLITSGWICFAAEPMKANHTLVEKFYANVFETSFNGEVVTTIWGVQVHYRLANCMDSEMLIMRVHK